MMQHTNQEHIQHYGASISVSLILLYQTKTILCIRLLDHQMFWSTSI